MVIIKTVLNNLKIHCDKNDVLLLKKDPILRGDTPEYVSIYEIQEGEKITVNL